MRDMTMRFLMEAYAGESQAHMRYKNFAKKAKEEGLANIGRLFEAISFAEQVHASNHFNAASGVKSTAENLTTAVGGEAFEVAEMYPTYMAVAELQQEKKAAVSMHWAFEAEKIHKGMYEDAKKSADAKKDISIGTIQICGNCGYTVEGEAPDKCPVCGVAKGMFHAF